MRVFGNQARYPRSRLCPEDVYANELAADHVFVSMDERGIYRIGQRNTNPAFPGVVGFGADVYEAFSNFLRAAIYSGLCYQFLYGKIKALLLEKEKAA